jgi:hypothetical protein
LQPVSGLITVPHHLLHLSVSDDLDSASEETKAPHQLKGMLWLGRCHLIFGEHPAVNIQQFIESLG